MPRPRRPAFAAKRWRSQRRGVRDHPLGAARAQLHENYIIAQTANGIVIVDQHAAHERLVYERLKRQMAENGIKAQALLIPEIVELSPADAARILDAAPALAALGLTIEPFGGNAVAIRETPAILGPVNGAALLRDILDELADSGDSQLAAGHDRRDPVAAWPATAPSAPVARCGPKR